jgi:hypothetical protein
MVMILYTAVCGYIGVVVVVAAVAYYLDLRD